MIFWHAWKSIGNLLSSFHFIRVSYDHARVTLKDQAAFPVRSSHVTVKVQLSRALFAIEETLECQKKNEQNQLNLIGKLIRGSFSEFSFTLNGFSYVVCFILLRHGEL